MQGEIIAISRQEAINFLLPRHYSGRVPSITYAYGWYIDRKLKAVVTYGKPASPFLCKGICGEKWADRVYELNRLCREEDFTLPLSHFVAETLKRLKCLDWIVVSYSDTAMHHNGYIYQACNFLYTGQTKERTDIYAGRENTHVTTIRSNGRTTSACSEAPRTDTCIFARERKRSKTNGNAICSTPYNLTPRQRTETMCSGSISNPR